MKASIYHLQINVRAAAVSLPFYKDLLGYLEYRVLHESRQVAGFTDGSADIWIIETDARFAAAGFHRKRMGLNHVAFLVGRRDEVDRFRDEFLRVRGIPAL